MSSNTNFPAFTSNMNFNSGTIKGGGQKCSTSVWLCTWCNVKVPLTGEWYWEYITDSFTYAWMGIGKVFIGGSNHHNNGFGFTQNGEYRYNGSNVYSGSATSGNIGTGDIVGVYVNAGVVKVYVNNSLDFTYTQNLSDLGSNEIYPWAVGSSNVTVNFGQDSSFLGVKTAQGNTDKNGFGDFYYTPPGDALALCSANTPIDADIDPAQTDDNYPAKQFGAYTYTGNSGSAVTVSTDFKPDLIWIKSRGSTDNNYLQDSSRGFGNNKSLSSNATGSEGYNGGAPSSSGAQYVGSSSFQAYGADWSKSSDNMIAWCWRANGGTTTSDSTADITVTRQSNAAGGFAILTYTGNGSDNQTIAHGLGAKPAFIIIKNRDTSNGWSAWTQHLGDNSKWIQLDSNAGAQSDSNQFYNSGMTTSNIGVRSGASVNGSGNDLVAYVWSEVEGYSKFGHYEGNNNVNGPYIQMGFRPRMVVIKAIDSSQMWAVCDTARETFNPLGEKILQWNSTDAEFDASGFNFDILSNGIKIRKSDTNINSSATFIYMAWGDVPFKYNNAF